MSNVRSLRAELSYDELRIEWCRSLNDMTIRDFAADYLRGIVTEDTTDAFAEYERRFGKYVKGQSAAPRKAKKRRSGK